MDGSGTIRVLKRDGSEEPFDTWKLAAAMMRAMRQTEGELYDACQLALAIELYLSRNGRERLPSSAILEMGLKVLRRCGHGAAATALEAHSDVRRVGRARLRVCHDDGQVTLWEKGWLSRLAEGMWFLSRPSGRILAGYVERELLAAGRETVSRHEVVEMLNRLVAEYGLADAVPLPAGG